MDFIAAVNLATATILALLLLSMSFEYAQIKFYAYMTVGILIAPLLLALVGNSSGWFAVDYLEVIRLERGVFSIIIATGYGAAVGLVLNLIKKKIISAFRSWRKSKVESTPL
ncbi:hypothetical protein F3F96_08300 [Mariprofundus sp. NF]|uniref:hypothetical protein n=1 Tax=Mariprofundus sp. NF TaxID=2608716 RepID=UPI0015A30F97|nr:hypothetical protein [Mariprofundus sp. NF]NWF39133.1 hypothetical protein [Mariprofundus sp. NF]